MTALVGYMAAILTTGSVVPQIVHTLRTRDVRGISLPMWFSLSTGIGLWLAYGIAIRSGPVAIANAISLALDLSVIGLTIRLRGRTNGMDVAGGR